MALFQVVISIQIDGMISWSLIVFINTIETNKMWVKYLKVLPVFEKKEGYFMLDGCFIWNRLRTSRSNKGEHMSLSYITAAVKQWLKATWLIFTCAVPDFHIVFHWNVNNTVAIISWHLTCQNESVHTEKLQFQWVQ